MNTNTKAGATVKGINDLGNEVSAWEVRVLSLQNESQELNRRNSAAKSEIESALNIAKQDLDKQRDKTRAELAKIGEATAKLEADRAEFQGILMAFKKEKNSFDDERSKIQANAKLTEDLRQKLSNFVLTIRRESEFL